MHDEAFWINFFQLRFFESLVGGMLDICPHAWLIQAANPVFAGVTHLARRYPRAKVVVDGYHFDAAYQERARAGGHVLLVLDDIGHLPSRPPVEIAPIKVIRIGALDRLKGFLAAALSSRAVNGLAASPRGSSVVVAVRRAANVVDLGIVPGSQLGAKLRLSEPLLRIRTPARTISISWR